MGIFDRFKHKPAPQGMVKVLNDMASADKTPCLFCGKANLASEMQSSSAGTLVCPRCGTAPASGPLTEEEKVVALARTKVCDDLSARYLEVAFAGDDKEAKLKKHREEIQGILDKGDKDSPYVIYKTARAEGKVVELQLERMFM